METSIPWDGRLIGDKGPYSAGRWQAMYHHLFGSLDGVVLSGSGDAEPSLLVTESSPAGASVRVATGAAVVRGIYYHNDAAETLAIAANVSGNPRIDRVVLRADYALQTVRLALKQGVPAGSPSAPALIQIVGVLWEESLALIQIADSFTTITDANITETRSVASANGFPTGATIPYPVTTAPAGWLLADGTAVSRTDYADLFSIIGVSFGVGDGSTTFNLPDMRGRTFVILDNLGGTSANRVTSAQADTVGGSSGAETHALTVPEMPSHQHAYRGVVGGGSSTTSWSQGSGAGPFNDRAVDATGGGGSHNNMQPYMAFGAIIKT